MNDLLIILLIVFFAFGIIALYFFSKMRTQLSVAKNAETYITTAYNELKEKSEKELEQSKTEMQSLVQQKNDLSVLLKKVETQLEMKNSQLSDFKENISQLNLVKSEKENHITELENSLTYQKTRNQNLEQNLKEEKEKGIQNQQKSDKWEQQKSDLEQKMNQLEIVITQKNATIDGLQKKLVEDKQQIEELNQKFKKEFENLAQKILDDKSEKFSQQNKNQLQNLLNPLAEKIKVFEKKVEDTHKESLQSGAMLRQQILGLSELSQQMNNEARNLTKALKGDTKTQGNWGEMILRTVLEKSGLEKDLEYFEQQSFTTDDGKKVQPDVVVHLPENKRMIIDSKVSLVAYERYVNTEDKEKKIGYAKEHILSVYNHINQLSAKNYHDLYKMESPDFVLLFIPIEAAFAVASQHEPTLYQKAFEKNIILVTPTTLLAVLKTIDSMWHNEKQKINTLKIAKQAASMYDVFVNLTNEMSKLGRQIDTVKNSHRTTMKKLSGQQGIINKMESLKKLGVKANKTLNPNLLEQIEHDDDLDETTV